MRRFFDRPGHHSADGYSRKTFMTQINDALAVDLMVVRNQPTTPPCSYQFENY